MMRIRLSDENVIAVKGNSHFINRVNALLQPIYEKYWRVAELNMEPMDQKRFDVEIQMASEAQAEGKLFTGKYVSFTTDDGDLCYRCTGPINQETSNAVE